MFNILDRIRPTTSGLDQLPAWFLRRGAPVFCKTLDFSIYLCLHPLFRNNGRQLSYVQFQRYK